MAIRYREGRKLPFIVYWKNPFTGKTEELPCPSESEAKKQNSLIKHQLKYERDSFRPEPASEEIQGDSLEACYYAYLKEKRLSQSSFRAHLSTMKPVLAVLGSKPVQEITRYDIDSLKKTFLDGTIKPVTARARLSILRTLIRWCAENGIIDQVPMFPKLPAANYEKFIPPTPDDLAAICSVSAPHLIRVALLGAQLGVRVGPSELLKMEWSHIDFTRGVARVRAARKRADQPWREVPIRENLLRLMREWYEEDSNIGMEYIIHYKGKKVDSVKKAWAGALSRAGITRRIRPYDLRHAFATEAIAAGVDIKTVAQIMGDDPRMLLEHYQHVADKQKRAAVEALPEIVFTAKNYGSKKTLDKDSSSGH